VTVRDEATSAFSVGGSLNVEHNAPSRVADSIGSDVAGTERSYSEEA